MDQQLAELRGRIAILDREIVHALAQRRRHGRNHPDVAACSGTEADRLDARIRTEYFQQVAPMLAGDSAVEADAGACAAADQAVIESVRQRMGVVLDIARVKASSQSARIRAHIAARDAAGLTEAITQPSVETEVVARAAAFATALQAGASAEEFSETIAAIFRNWVIPLSRRVQVEALLDGRLAAGE